jgi:hypothetical protein
MSKLNKILDELHVELGEQLLEKIKSGKARASDLNVARQFLKDNSYEVPPTQENPLRDLVDELPFKNDEQIQ